STAHPAGLEEMTAEVREEHYLHAAGRKPTYEIAAVYERYAELTTLEQGRALAEGAPAERHRFACEAYLGDGTKHLSEEIANAEAALTVPVDGEEVPYRELTRRLLNEPDGARRLRLYDARCAVTAEHMNPLHERVDARVRELVGGLGAGSTLELYEGFGFDPQALHRSTEAFLAGTDALYRRSIDAELRARVGVALADARPSHVRRSRRGARS